MAGEPTWSRGAVVGPCASRDRRRREGQAGPSAVWTHRVPLGPRRGGRTTSLIEGSSSSTRIRLGAVGSGAGRICRGRSGNRCEAVSGPHRTATDAAGTLLPWPTPSTVTPERVDCSAEAHGWRRHWPPSSCCGPAAAGPGPTTPLRRPPRGRRPRRGRRPGPRPDSTPPCSSTARWPRSPRPRTAPSAGGPRRPATGSRSPATPSTTRWVRSARPRSPTAPTRAASGSTARTSTTWTVEFIEGLAETYDDDGWQMYDEDGNVLVTETQEEFEAAARPDVDPDLVEPLRRGQARMARER